MLACLLLASAVIGGTLLTFLFDYGAPRAARLCMGAGLGMALLAGLGFVFALWMGLNAASIAASSAAMLLPLLLLINGAFRSRVASQFWTSRKSSRKAAPQRTGNTAAYMLFYAVIAVLLGLFFSQAAFERPDGIFTGIENNLGDLPLHLQVINSFSQGNNLPPEDPTYAGVRFAYPFLVDFLTAMLVRAGAGVIGAMCLQNMLLALALVGLLHYWTILLTRNRVAGVIAPLLVLLSGGLGWWLLFSDYTASDGLFSLLGSLPHDYTILREPDTLLRWGNSLTTLFGPQRSILFGAPLAILIFCQWWSAISQPPDAGSANETGSAGSVNAPGTVRQKVLTRAQRNQKEATAPQSSPNGRMLAAGIMAGLLPLIHAHTFLVVMGVAACLAAIFRAMWRRWLLFFALAIPVSLPEVLWLANTGGVKVQSYLGWQPGWDHGTHNILWFWFVNAGPFLMALITALLWRRSDLALQRRLIRFYAPFLLCFLLPNLIKLAPWVWDNIKVLFWWYIASAPLVALLLAKWWQQKSRWRWLAPVAFATMTLAGSLDVWRVVTGTIERREFDPQDIAIARIISDQAAPRALVLHAPTFNTPVFLTGRRSLLGFPAWMWSRGIDYSQRDFDIQRIYSGDPDASALLQQYNVDYVLTGPAEYSMLRVNEQFLTQYKKVAEVGPYRLYEVKQQNSKATKEPEVRTGK